MEKKSEKWKEERGSATAPSGEDEKAVELRRVYKTFRSDTGAEVPALADLSLAVKQGEFVTMIGATGCGKTTTLNVIVGLETFDKGQMRLGAGLHPGENIACVFQHYTLFPWRTALRNVSFGLQMRGISRRERKVRARELLAQVGLGGFEDSYPHELSGGMRQRAAIAQALAVDPKLLLMDEPFGAVDDSTRKDLQEMLIGLWEQNQTTVLFVTHNIDEALVMGDRVFVFSDRPGRVVREFDVDLPRPRDRMAREFTDLFVEVRQSLTTALD
jgi:NitT/TauT family transport system ATP-binding protein